MGPGAQRAPRRPTRAGEMPRRECTSATRSGRSPRSTPPHVVHPMRRRSPFTSRMNSPAVAATSSSSPSSNRITTDRASTSARARLTIVSSTRSRFVSPPTARAISVVASSLPTARSSCRRRSSELEKRRALSIAIEAHSARTCTVSSSASVNGPSSFSVRYRLPQASPRIRMGTPRNVRIGGCPGGKPKDRGCEPTSSSRSGCSSPTSNPRTPRPRGSSPIASRVFSSMPRA